MKSIPYIIYMVVAAIALPFEMNAEAPRSRVPVVVTVDNFARTGDSLTIGCRIDCSAIDISSKEGVDLIPIVSNSTELVELPAVSVRGRNNHLVHTRTLSLMNRAELAACRKPYAELKHWGKNESVVNYRCSLPWQEWMESAMLGLRTVEYGCGAGVRQGDGGVLCSKVSCIEKLLPIEPYVVRPSFTYVVPVTEPIKRRDVQSVVRLDFRVNVTAIDSRFGNNPAELERVGRMMDEIVGNADVEVDRVDIVGFASPEGTLEYNRRLSEGRANALRNYMTSRIDLPRDCYRVEFGGENWDGLVDMVAASDIGQREEILRIIRNEPLEQVRERQLAALDAGGPWQHMKQTIFPLLRYAVCTVHYTVRAFDLEQARRTFETAPQNLSLNEMYLVANSYGESSDKFAQVFDTAVKLFPDDDTANLNAAAAALRRCDTASADGYLARVHADSPASDDLRGVAAMLRGDCDSARSYLTRAARAAEVSAQANLVELERKEANIESIKRRQQLIEQQNKQQ